MLGVLDRKTLVVVAVLLFDLAENIENHGDPAVADGMNAQLQTGGSGLREPLAHGAGRMHLVAQQAAVPRLIRERFDI